MLNNKFYSALNITGLSAGMAVALLIGLWIHSQFSYDRFLPGYNQLFQVKLNFDYNGDIKTQSGTSLPLIDELRNNYPEVKYASETDWGSQHTLVAADKKLNIYGLQVGKDFMKMFPFTLLKGDVNTALNDPNSVVLTASTAKSLFGDLDPVNRIIRIDNKNNIVVTGIMEDLPKNSTLQFNYLLPYTFAEQKEVRAQWANYSYPAYLQLQPGTDPEAFGNKIKDVITKHDPTHKIEVILHPAKDWRLLTEFSNGKASGGMIEYVRMFGLIGILVLIIACINFTNLSTARSEKRAREVGVRKAIGSRRKDLIFQFLSESMLLTFIAFLLSLVIIQLSLPYFNRLTSGNIVLPYSSPVFWAIMICYVLFTGILAGCRPAFYLSSIKPIKVLKGSVQAGKWSALPHKVLVVLQFSCSIALIISTYIIYQQIKYVKDRPKGYNSDKLLMTGSSEDLVKNYGALKNDLLQSGQITNVTTAASPVTYFTSSFTLSDWPGKKPEESLEMVTMAISQDYFETTGMTLSAGRDFGSDAGPDTLNIILNEAAVDRLRLKDPISQLITFNYSKNPMRVIGVVKNAVIGSPFFSVSPAIFVYNPAWVGSIIYRLNPGVNTHEAITKISGIFNRYNPSSPYDYQFADEAYETKFSLEVLIGKLAGIFSALAIFISCLGLFGLAAYVAERRKKEMGIRKVLGASVFDIWFLLSRNFLTLVVISCVFASPLAFYFLHEWLQKFDYRIMIGPAAFLLSAAFSIIITIVTVSYQSITSAMSSPVNSLRAD
ncbi:MAG: ABC transporter permease [Chitinophagaceae bacterium]